MPSFRFPAGLMASLFAFAVGIVPAGAQDYPARSVTVIVPFAAGGPTDVVARIVGDHMSKTLGQTLVIENMLGAGGTTASTRAMRASLDGYTIIMGHMGTRGLGRALSRTWPTKRTSTSTDRHGGRHADLILSRRTSRKDLRVRDLREGQQAKLNMAHAGVGSVSHVTGLLLNHLLGVNRPDPVGAQDRR